MSKRMYKCEKHKSNEGYLDDKKKWHCWYCYSEDKLSNIGGRLVKEFEIEGFLVRIVDKSDIGVRRRVDVQTFRLKNSELLQTTDHRDLSMALREYERQIDRIDNGLFQADEPSRKLRPYGGSVVRASTRGRRLNQRVRPIRIDVDTIRFVPATEEERPIPEDEEVEA